MPKYKSVPVIGSLIGFFVLIGLYLTSLHSYLLFHYLVESFSILVAFSIFTFAFNTFHMARNSYLIVLGVAYLFCGSFDLLHTLSYKGMGVLGDGDANLPTQFWIIARGMESISLLIAPYFFSKSVKPHMVLALYAVVSIVLLASLFPINRFPDCYIDGVGLTPFKKISEYVICTILAAAGFQLYKQRQMVGPVMYRLIIASIGFTILSELAFTFYVSVYDISNMVGHMAKIISFYLVYRAIVAYGLLAPYKTMFSELASKKTALESYSRKLESRVDKRTMDLENANQELKALSNSLMSAEEAERQRIARDLHDSIGQSLTAIKVYAENFLIRWKNRTDNADLEILHKLVPMTQDAIHDVRRIVMDLRPSILDDLGIVATINWACREFIAVYETVTIEKSLELTEDEVPQGIKTAIFRFLQEGLNNVAKHSGANCVRIYLGRQDGHIVFEVSDNGCGFETDGIKQVSTPRRGFGLAGMRERLELTGAELTLSSQPGDGTLIRAAWPSIG